jgi:predicted DNA-binding transcriptional regulator AlpA
VSNPNRGAEGAQVQHLTPMQLAARYQTGLANIYQMHHRNPERLPPALHLGGRRLLWRLVDVEAWEAARVGGVPTPRSTGQRNKPGRKSVAAKAREAAAHLQLAQDGRA